MNKDILCFILHGLYEARISKVIKSKRREYVAKRYLRSRMYREKYKNLEVNMFCKAWDYLIEKEIIK